MRGYPGKLLLILVPTVALFATACIGSDEIGMSTDGAESDVEAGDGDGEQAESTGSADSSPETTVGPSRAARAALQNLVIGLGGGDYRSASQFLLNEGISEEVIAQLGITEDEAYVPATLVQALANYCDAVDCSRGTNIGTGTSSDDFFVTFAVSVEQADGTTELVDIPMAFFEGRYTANVLPFGSLDESAGTDTDVEVRLADGTPYYEGELSAAGWRVAPVGPDPLVTVWDRTRVLNSGHGTEFVEIATGEFGELTYTTSGVVFQKPPSVADGEEFDDTIWISREDGPEVLVAGTAGNDLMYLQGSRVIDWGEDIVYYQIRTGTVPEDTKSTLYAINTLTEEVETIAVVGGWESDVDFFDIEASYPLVVGMWAGEGFRGPMILNFETGDVVYNADQAGLSCFEGDVGCPGYWAATLVDGIVYGLRPPDIEVESQEAMSLHRFDPDTGLEVEITRFAWDPAVWWPRSIMFHTNRVVISVEDGAGTPLPAVSIDLETGLASTLTEPGFVSQSYIS